MPDRTERSVVLGLSNSPLSAFFPSSFIELETFQLVEPFLRRHSFIMKFQFFAVLLAVSASNAYDLDQRHAEVVQRRQTSSDTPSVTATTTAATFNTSSAASLSTSTAAGSIITTTSGSAATAPASATWGTSVPPLSQISSGMPSGVTEAVSTTYVAGASPTYYSGAEPLPTLCIFVRLSSNRTRSIFF